MSRRRPAGEPLPGFPVDRAFSSKSEIDAYLAEEKLLCLRCGKRFSSVGHHLATAHGMSVDGYKDFYGIPRSTSLASDATRAAFRANIVATRADGRLAESDATLAERAQVAAEASRMALRHLATLPTRKLGRDGVPRETLERIVTSVEAGTVAATAVKRGGISWSGFHGALKSHSDLHARYRTASKGRTKK